MGGRQLGGRIDSTSLNGIQLNSLLEVSTSHFGIFVNLDYLTDALDNIHQDAFIASSLSGYRIASCCSNYGGIQQRWVVVESKARKEADLKQLEKRLEKQLTKAQSELKQLCQQQFACEKDALLAAERFERKLPLHQLGDIKVLENKHHIGRGRPRKDAEVTCHYQLCATLLPKQTAIDVEFQRTGRFILATNVLDSQERA